ncbi:hypothetical protein P9112_009221 [Eukaryota sp. TZLM1-RC]
MSSKVLDQLLSERVHYTELPSDIQSGFTESEYEKRLLNHSFIRHLPWDPSLTFIQEPLYYTKLISTIRSSFALFPYHLAQNIFTHCQTSPFRYYIDMLHETIDQELSYDHIPNFTALDVERTTGIGRNQYIDIVNSFRRTSKSMFSRRKTIIRSLLPSSPLTHSLPQWCYVELGVVRVGDVDSLSETDKGTIELLKQEPLPITSINPSTLSSLLSRDYVLIAFPVSLSDVFIVQPLQGFVMNRLGNDWFEGVLYDVFMAFNGVFTIESIASTLSLSVNIVCIAASVLARLNLVFKRSKTENSPLTSEDQLIETRVAVFCDSFLAGILMMGQFGGELKQWGQNLFEVGKIDYHAITTVKSLLLTGLEEVDLEHVEHDVMRSYQYTSSLSILIESLLTIKDLPFDFIRLESLKRLKSNVVTKMISSFYTNSINLTTSFPPCLPSSLSNTSPMLPLSAHAWIRAWWRSTGDERLKSWLFPKGSVFDTVPVDWEGDDVMDHVIVEPILDGNQQTASQYSGNEIIDNCSYISSFTGTGACFQDGVLLKSIDALNCVNDLGANYPLSVTRVPCVENFCLVDVPFPFGNVVDDLFLSCDDVGKVKIKRFVLVGGGCVEKDHNCEIFKLLDPHKMKILNFAQNLLSSSIIERSFGFARFLVFFDNEICKIYPYDISFSIPLFSIPLTRHLSKMLTTVDFLQVSKDKESNSLTSSIVDFITKNGGIFHELGVLPFKTVEI